MVQTAVGHSLGFFVRAVNLYFQELTKLPQDMKYFQETKLSNKSILTCQQEQYKFLHEVILEEYTSRGTRMTFDQFDLVFPDNSRINKEFKASKHVLAHFLTNLVSVFHVVAPQLTQKIKFVI